MSNEFAEVMSKRSDADLLYIVDGPPEDYQPAALEAAKRELERRNLPAEQINLLTQTNQQKALLAQQKATAPLRTIWKIVAFFLPGILYIAIYGVLRGEGYIRKGRELVRWTFYGFLFYAGLIIVFKLLSKFI